MKHQSIVCDPSQQFHREANFGSVSSFIRDSCLCCELCVGSKLLAIECTNQWFDVIFYKYDANPLITRAYFGSTVKRKSLRCARAKKVLHLVCAVFV